MKKEYKKSEITRFKSYTLVFFLVGLVGIIQSQTTYTFNFTGSVQTATLNAGNYEIECWGANGGDGGGASIQVGSGGKGGYSKGVYTLLSPAILYIYVGGKGQSSNTAGAAMITAAGGWNGGGGGFNGSSSTNFKGGGGGGTDVRTTQNTTYSNRIIVAGGGGGAGGATSAGYVGLGGNGGGLSGQDGVLGTSQTTHNGKGGSQTTGGAGGIYATSSVGSPGVLGIGGNGGSISGNTFPAGGGGGGWYGGGGGATQGGSGGGGSGYVGGVASGVTFSLGQVGFVQNPIQTGDGLVLIKELCSISLVASTANSLNPSICSGQSLTLTTDAVGNYSWSTGATTSSLVVSPTTSTVYSLTALSPSNCTTSRTISVTVSGGQPTLSVVSSTNQTCLGKTATLTASGAVTYTWTNGVTNGVSFNPQATNTYTVIGENGCGTVQAVSTISILPLPLTVVTSNSVVCTNKTATLSATASATSYTWQPGNVIGASPNLIVNPQTSTNYTVTATDGTCVGVANVSVQADPVPTIQIVASATTACPGDAVTFTASGASSYTWTSLNNQTGANATINPTTTAIYNVIGDNQFGCQSNASQVVQVVTAPNINASTNSPSICAGGSSTLNVTGANSYTWTGGTNGNSVVVNPNQTTVFTVDGSNSGNPCIATRTLEITVFTPSLTISGNTTICDGQTTNLTAGAATSYTWAHESSFPNAVSNVNPNITTTYTVNATHEFNGGQVKCPISGNIQVVVNPNPTVSVVPTRAGMCAKESNTLTGSGASTYTWVSTSTTIAAPEVTIRPTNNGFINYTVTGVNSQGCEGSVSYVLNVSACSGLDELVNGTATIYVYPNPSNGDFTIQASKDMQLKLINQLGQVIEVIQLNEKNNYKTQFNHLSSGVYFITGDNLNKKVIVSK